MGVRRDFAAEAVRIGDDGLHLFQGELRGVRIVTLGKHSASRANLDDVGAILDDLARLVLHVLNAVGNASFGGVKLVGQQVVVAMSAGDAERRAAYQHARAGHIAGIDGIAQGNIRVIEAPTLRTVVKPASSVVFALCAPISASRGTKSPVLHSRSWDSSSGECAHRSGRAIWSCWTDR